MSLTGVTWKKGVVMMTDMMGRMMGGSWMMGGGWMMVIGWLLALGVLALVVLAVVVVIRWLSGLRGDGGR
jgi:hypothetical protein